MTTPDLTGQRIPPFLVVEPAQRGWWVMCEVCKAQQVERGRQLRWAQAGTHKLTCAGCGVTT